MKKTVILNSAKFNFDGRLDFSRLKGITEVFKFDESTAEEIIQRSGKRDIIISKELPIPADLIERLDDSVKLICEAGTGFNNIDISAARKRGIMVCNVPGYSTGAVAQLAVSFILNLSSSIPRQVIMINQKQFDNFTKFLQVPHHEVQGKVLGVIGAGAIGSEVIRIASVLGMKVLFYDIKEEQMNIADAEYSALDDLLRESDFVSLHCPLTEKTKHILNRDSISLMKQTAFVINTSRGALIEEGDLIDALMNNRIAGAALDVQETEPPALDNPLFTMDNVIVTPHIGWQTLESRQRLMERLTGNIEAFLNGKPENVIN
ncbi:MAG TPA: NAD(P)-dependent oxidoreductase [Spirochaetota bacterium]|nr:NAD(P)-dependent oxidoreductase [Spirochaetota bacterium]